jgi:phosphoglycerate dehydrogenase-like enzyme
LTAHKVIVTEPIHQAGIELLERNGVEVVQLSPGSDEETLQAEARWAAALITRGGIKVTRGFMESAPLLKAVGVHGIGCDHVDLEAASELGKVVLNTPFALSESVAEMAIALLFALSRRVVSADKAVRLKSFGVKLLYNSRTRKPDLEEEIGIEYATLDSLIERSDIISLNLPYTRETHHLIDAKRIAAMKDGVYIVNTARGRIIDQTALIDALKSGKIAAVNTARGRIIDQTALIDALKSGKIAAAGLDVFEEEPLDPGSPLASMDNVVLTPHLAASSEEAMERMAVQVAEGVLKVLNGEAPDYPVVN